ncbi:zinc finger MYM-type protein 2-like [Saccostrea cucullata]|uniref:zinc finger MYM-type protein 2-like n=1 Tax=Saccostrea cuccullata TaxID=36930 RepID=UPI002ED62B25
MELDELDFLISDLDDITLSQICEVIENEECALEGINDMSIGDFDFGFLFGEQEELLKTEPPPEIPEPSASPETDEPQGRFARPITDKEIKLLTEDQECKNTKSNTRWAFGVWRKWREQRNKLSSNTGEFIPEFSAMDASCMDYWLQRFVVEVRNQKGNEYTPKSLYYLMCGLLRHLRDIEIFGMNFLDHNDDRFARTRKVLDARMKSLVAQGIGTTVRQADPILPEQEDILWEKGVLGQNSAISLQNTVFFYACKVFGLRGCDEHRQLMCEQFKLGSDAQGQFIQFVGRQNKTYQGGLRQMQLSNKNIKHYCKLGDRSLYEIFDLYLTTLGNDGLFYRKPLPGPEIRFGTQALGMNKLKSMMKEMCAAGGLTGNFTNHSGKRTCATQMYLSGIDEQEIMARTGHRSEKAVRKYKRSSDKNT